MATKELDSFFKNYILNEIVLLPKKNLKCCCCNISLKDDVSTLEHLALDSHKSRIESLVNVQCTLSEEQCQNIFLNHIVIFTRCLSDENKHKMFYTSACFYCDKRISNGYNGIQQHLTADSKHLTKPIWQYQQYCKVCEIPVIVLKNHEEGYFHIEMLKNITFYKAEVMDNLASNLVDTVKLIKIPSLFSSKFEYKNIMRMIVNEESDYQKMLLRSQIMNDITVTWVGEVGPLAKPKAYFQQPVVDNNFIKLKLGDEVVIASSGFRQWNMLSQVIDVPLYDDGTVCIQLENGNGVKKNILYPYKVTKKYRSTPRWRQIYTLKKFCEIDDNQLLVNVVLNRNYVICENPEDFIFNPTDIKIIKGKPTINVSQYYAVRMALEKPICLIQGPPGTGKTETSVTLIHNMLRQQPHIKILVCAPSNTAVDLITRKLHSVGINLIRLYSKRYDVVRTDLHHLTLLETAFNFNPKLRTNYTAFVEKTLKPNEFLEYKSELNEAIEYSWNSTDVVCCTCITAGSEDFKDRKFDVVLVDEAAQAVETETLVPIVLHRAARIILVGDHKQLGPLVMSNKASEAGFGMSLFERLKNQNKVSSIMLETQYRMHPDIAAFPSSIFYEGRLKSALEKEERQLSFKWLGSKDNAVIFFDINAKEKICGTSFSNEAESLFAVNMIKNILSENVSEEKISIISPYDAQRRLLLQHLRSNIHGDVDKIKVANIDGFQGMENEIIIISFVRCNNSQSIGFLKDPRRFNVALTRAQKKLVIIGNINTLYRDKLFKQLINYIANNGSIIPS